MNAAAGAVLGYVSFALNMPLLSAAVALAAMAALNLSLRKLLKLEQDKKWWLGNAVAVYLFMWFIVWTIFYNL